MTEILYIVALCTAAGLFFAGLSVAHIRRRRLLAAGGDGLFGLLLLALAALLVAIIANLYTYQRLTFEREVARLDFRQLAPQHYRVRLLYPEDGGEAVYELRGDEWQMDARVLKWHGLANLLGLDAQYRLERLSGRYLNVDQERSAPRSVHDLSQEQGLDLWALTQRYPDWIPLADALYGSAAYLPMRDGARFEVAITQSGLLARALNEPARKSISRWEN